MPPTLKKLRLKNPPRKTTHTTKPSPPSSPATPILALDIEPEPTFAETLFAALRDPAAAQFWADIYGQPIHTYPRPVLSGQPLSDEEYAAYVQRRVWENTREGIEEGARERERARRVQAQEDEKERREQRKRKREVREQERQVERDVVDAMREREDGVWRERVGVYIAGWRSGEIPWPCVGRVDEECVGVFLRRVARVTGVGFEQVVKAERVRWHPDKILQRFGEEVCTEERMARVNEVWRAVDSIWRRMKD